MEHPDRSALDTLYASQTMAWQPAFTPLPWYRRLWAWLRSLFGESNFATSIDRRPERQDRIRLAEISLESARRLNSAGSFRSLNLDEHEMVTVVCDTLRVLGLEAAVYEELDRRGSKRSES